MRLSQAQIRQYHEQGYLSPIRVLSPERAVANRRQLEAAEAANGGPFQGAMKQKPHLLFIWLDALVRDDAVLDAVEGVIGPNILCWASGFFTKEAHDPSYVSWHQDLTYWGLEPADIVTAWVALSPSTPESGCMRVVPGSHKQDVLPHTETFAEQNLLSRGQEVQVEVDEREAVDVVLQPGEMSLHHVKLIHGSGASRADDRRIGFAIRYVPTYVRQTAGAEDSALLVRGVDTYHHFLEETPPVADLDEAALAHHAAVTARAARILMRGTGKESFR
ncbi:MAG TPA: phytanoyl-CoA dioxygenase family protein [Geminicoccaceae bacterium]|nr:phytanoyl-CoA dioxygenase family protein [Geminicoccaceae bacterium]